MLLQNSTDGDPPVQFLEGGSGPPLLFLHGFNGGAGLWAPNMTDLTNAGYRCVAPDLPGWGNSPPLPGFTYRVPDLCRWLCGFMGRQIGEPVTLIGHSFGGAVGLQMALHYPERVRRLVLVNSVGLTPKTMMHYRLLCIPGLGEWLLKPSKEKIRRELAWFAVGDLSRIPPDVLEYIDRMVQNPWFTRTSLNWARRNGVFWRGAAAISVRHRLREIRQPTLILVGLRDPIIDPADSVAAAELIPNARLERFPDGLHLLPLDHRAAFARLVAEFASLSDEAAAATESAQPAAGQ